MLFLGHCPLLWGQGLLLACDSWIRLDWLQSKPEIHRLFLCPLPPGWGDQHTITVGALAWVFMLAEQALNYVPSFPSFLVSYQPTFPTSSGSMLEVAIFCQQMIGLDVIWIPF